MVAGLTHVLFLKSNRALIELSGVGRMGSHFDLLASISKIKYNRCWITEGPATTQMIYDCIQKRLSEMCPFTAPSMIRTRYTETTTTFAGNASISMITD